GQLLGQGGRPSQRSRESASSDGQGGWWRWITEWFRYRAWFAVRYGRFLKKNHGFLGDGHPRVPTGEATYPFGADQTFGFIGGNYRQAQPSSEPASRRAHRSDQRM